MRNKKGEAVETAVDLSQLYEEAYQLSLKADEAKEAWLKADAKARDAYRFAAQWLRSDGRVA